MAAAWSGANVPLVLEEWSMSTAENATECLKLILAMPGVSRVTVVTSSWHLRAPYFFRHYRNHGLHVRFRFAPTQLRDWPGFLIYELRGLRHMRRLAKTALRNSGHAHCGRHSGSLSL